MAMLFSFSFIFINKSYSQDLHYSQYNYSPLNLNPSNAGFDNADYRLFLNNRTQWKSVTAPYKTFSVGFDMKTLALGAPRNKPNTGFGLQVNNDKDGDSHLKTLNIATSFAYFKSLNDSAYVLTGGLQLGYTQKSFDLNDLNFDNQFTGDLFDPSAPTGEPVTNDKMSYLDLGFGLGAQLFRSDDFQLDAGAAVQHINSPKNSFYSSGKVNIAPHYIFNTGIRYRLSDQMQVLPSLLYMKQNSISEFDINAQLKYELDNPQLPVSNIYAGVGMRMKDAIVLNVGADFKNVFAGFSYDINTSGLKHVSKGRGAIEFALIYKVKTVRSRPPGPPCIIY
ncbi:MAG: PorP/SprF family type IX secretion system membrane protein [Bacteroidia bacterium]